MSELSSKRLLGELRSDADGMTRSAERHRTLDRMVEACDQILSGAARKVVHDGLPAAEFNFRRTPVPLIPPRIEEYVLARRALDLKARRVPSEWTGPMATTIRKDARLLEYVRVCNQEQSAKAVSGKLNPTGDQLLERVEDLALRSELRLLLSRARQTEQDLSRLKIAMRKLRPTFQIESLVDGTAKPTANIVEAMHTEVTPSADAAAHLAQAYAAVAKLTDTRALSKCGLEISKEFGNIVERKTRYELVSAEGIAALRSLIQERVKSR